MTDSLSPDAAAIEAAQKPPTLTRLKFRFRNDLGIGPQPDSTVAMSRSEWFDLCAEYAVTVSGLAQGLAALRSEVERLRDRPVKHAPECSYGDELQFGPTFSCTCGARENQLRAERDQALARVAALQQLARRVITCEYAYRTIPKDAPREYLEALPSESEWHSAVDALAAALPLPALGAAQVEGE